MTRPLVLLALSILIAPAWSHGAVYPASPGSAPAGGGPSGPTPPGPSGPAVPTGPGPARAGTPAPTTPGGMGGGGATAGGAGAGIDPASWELWWQHNQDSFLELKRHVDALEPRTGEDARWLGAAAEDSRGEITSRRVVPALLSLLERERANDVVTSAIVGLARLADGPLAARASEFARAFAPFTSDPNQEIAETAVLGRGLCGDEGAAPALVELLADGAAGRRSLGGREVPIRTRAFAAYALGLLASRSANEDVRRFVVHHLMSALRADSAASSDVRVACVLALGLVPLAWSGSSQELVDAPGRASRTRARSSIATASREEEIECLFAIWGGEPSDRLVSAHLPTTLARLADGGPPAVKARIATLLSSPLVAATRWREETVQGCVLALGRLEPDGDAESEKLVRLGLSRVALHGERQARGFALIALAQRAARGGDEHMAGETRHFLAARLGSGRSHERAWAALALGVLEHGRRERGEPNALSVRASLVSSLKDCGSPDELGAIAIGCGLAREEAAVPVLLAKLARTSDARLQGHLALALGLIGDARAGAALRAQLAAARFRPELLRATAIGLASMEDATLVPTLVETLERASSLSSQAAAASVLGWIGDRRSIEPLLSLLARSDVSASARGFAAAALGRVCDRDRLPWNAPIATGLNYPAATATLISGSGTGLLEIL